MSAQEMPLGSQRSLVSEVCLQEQIREMSLAGSAPSRTGRSGWEAWLGVGCGLLSRPLIPAHQEGGPAEAMWAKGWPAAHLHISSRGRAKASDPQALLSSTVQKM